MHPGLGNLSNMTITELENKIAQLNRYYFITPNSDVRQQIILLLDSYKLELQERRIAEKKKMSDSGDNSLDSLININ